MKLCQIVKMEVYVREVRLVICKLLCLKEKEAGTPDEACRDENSKLVGTTGLSNDPATLPSVS